MDDLQEILQYDPSLCNGVKHNIVEDKSSPILTNGGCDTEATPTPYLETKGLPQTLQTTPTPYLETKGLPQTLQTTPTSGSEPVKMEITPSQLFETTPIQPTSISKLYCYKYVIIFSLVPDINLLDDKLIRLLATQRIQQLLTSSYHTRTLNGLKQDLLTPPTTSYSGKKRHRGQGTCDGHC